MINFMIVFMAISTFFMIFLYAKIYYLHNDLKIIISQIKSNNHAQQHEQVTKDFGFNLEKRLEKLQNTKFAVNLSLRNKDKKNHGRKI